MYYYYSTAVIGPICVCAYLLSTRALFDAKILFIQYYLPLLTNTYSYLVLVLLLVPLELTLRLLLVKLLLVSIITISNETTNSYFLALATTFYYVLLLSATQYYSLHP